MKANNFEVIDTNVNRTTLAAIFEKETAVFTPKICRTAISNKLSTHDYTVVKIAEQWLRDHGKIYVNYISVDSIMTPKFQRPINLEKVGYMAHNWDWAKFDVPKVAYISGEDNFIIVDGQHRVAALKSMGVKETPAMILLGYSYEELANIFATQSDGKVRLSSFDKLVAGIEGRDPIYTQIVEACKKYKIKLCSKDTAYTRNIKSIRKLKQISKNFGQEGLEAVFQLFKDCGWEKDSRTYTEPGLNLGHGFLIVRQNPNFSYPVFIHELKEYHNITKYADHIKKTMGVETLSKHPEATIRNYIVTTWG